MSPRGAQCGIEDIAKAWVLILRRNTNIRFHIPRMTRIGQWTWCYCRWWVRSSLPYLGRSIKKIHTELKQPYEENESKYVIQDIRDIYSTLDEVFVRCTSQGDDVIGANFANIDSDSDNASDVNFKRRKRAKHDDSSNDDNVLCPVTQNLQVTQSNACVDASNSRVNELVDFEDSDDHNDIEFGDVVSFEESTFLADSIVSPEVVLSPDSPVPNSAIPSPSPVPAMFASAIINSHLKEYISKGV